jgi:hypothetical protein
MFTLCVSTWSRPSWPLGQPTPGVKLISTVIKREGLSSPGFADYWAGPHVEATKVNQIRPWRYVQNVVVPRDDADAPEIDGIGEESFQDPDFAKKRMATAPTAALKVLADAKNFMDVAKGRLLLATESVLKDDGRK